MGYIRFLFGLTRRRFQLFFHVRCSILWTGLGFMAGFLLCSILFDDGWESEKMFLDVQTAENWRKRLIGGARNDGVINEPQLQSKINRARFAASELGIRDRVLLLPWIRSPIGLSLHRWLLSKYFLPSSLRPIMDSSRLDPANLPDAIHVLPMQAHIQLLNAIANLSLQHNFDWFLLFPERTFLNPFQLQHILERLQWNLPVIMGHQNINAGGLEDLCKMEAGILLSNPAMRQLVEGRHLCHGIVAQSEESALEKCIRLTTNLSCQSSYQGVQNYWWHVTTDHNSINFGPLHGQISHLASLPGFFNRSLTVSPILSDSDIQALLEHFHRVEINQMDAEIDALERELISEFGKEVGWPVGVVEEESAPNRFQVPIWQLFFQNGTLFGNDPGRNVEEIEEHEELEEVIELARKQAEKHESITGDYQFEKVHQGNRRFHPERGMEYLVDLAYHAPKANKKLVRVHLSRPIHSTSVLEKVPFVKEDSDITIVVPVESLDQMLYLHTFLRSQLRRCAASRPANRPQIRFVVTARFVEAALIRVLGTDLVELEKKCKFSANSDSTLLLLQPAVGQTPHLPFDIVALDAAIDRYGHQTLFLLLSPFVDYQWDFLDRVRLNTIRQFQVFFPIPFTEFNPLLSLTKLTKEFDAFVIHKDRGRFDTDEFGVAAFYGVDYVSVRSSFGSRPTGLIHLFLNDQFLHVMRTIEPSLRMRYHARMCRSEEESDNCERRRREGMGTRAQLARLLFSNGG